MELIVQNGWMLAAVLAAISVGALLKGMMGLGLPLFVVPLLATLTTVGEAVLLMIIPGIGANLWVVMNRRRYRSMIVQHMPFLVSGFLGGVAGTAMLHVISDRALKILLVFWLAIYLLQYFLGKKPMRLFTGQGAFGYAAGLIAGVTQGSTGISAQVVAPYYHGRNLAAPAYAFLVAFTFLLFSAGQMTAALGTHLLTPQLLQLSLAALVPTLIFTRIGIRLADRISLELFNKGLLVVFCLMEVALLADVL